MIQVEKYCPAKVVYETIMKEIHSAEANVPENCTQCVNLVELSGLEIVTIGRHGDELLFFEGFLSANVKIRVLIHYSRAEVLLVVRPDTGVPEYKPKAQIGFAVEK